MNEEIKEYTASVTAPKVSAKSDMRGFLTSDKLKAELTKTLPKILPTERFVRTALTAITKTPKLLECTQESMAICLLDLSAIGLEADGRHAHLIPYKDRCTLIIDYKGLVQIAYRAGAKSIHADKVCKNDKFTQINGVVHHEIDHSKERGEVFAYFCTIVMSDGVTKSEVMNITEIEKIRKRSMSGSSGPWVTDFDEMAKKTTFRRCFKWLPSLYEHEAIISKHEQLEFDFDMQKDDKPKSIKSDLI